MKRILHDELPDDNYFILKYVINFLQEVCIWNPIPSDLWQWRPTEWQRKLAKKNQEIYVDILGWISMRTEQDDSSEFGYCIRT